MSTNIIIPTDAIDCNQLVSLAHSHGLWNQQSALKRVFRKGQPSIFWLFHKENGTSQYAPLAFASTLEQARGFGFTPITPNKFARELQHVR